MKQIIVINPHSFVDVITNSSSELFVLDTDKSVDFINEYLKKTNDYGRGNAYKYTIDTFLENISYSIEFTEDEKDIFRELLNNEKYYPILKKVFNQYIDNTSGYAPIDIDYIGKIIIDIDNNNNIDVEEILKIFNGVRYSY